MRVTQKRGSKGAKPKTPTKNISTPYLEGLVQFLNIKDFGSVDISKDLYRWLRHITAIAETATFDDWIADRKRQIAAALKLVAPFQRELIDKLLPFTRLEPPNPTYAENCLLRLTAELTRWKFQAVFVVENVSRAEEYERKFEAEAPGSAALDRRFRYADLNANHRMFAWAKGRWIVSQGFIPRLDEENRPLAFLYSIVAKALVCGELALLRRCPYCESFFLAAKDKRQIFCPGHMRLYYDDAVRSTVRVENSRLRRLSSSPSVPSRSQRRKSRRNSLTIV